MHEPPSFFEDKTKDIIHWDEQINSYLLPNLRDACNKYIIPTILCPFGCSEFIHKCGHVAIDMIFQRFLPKCTLKKYMNDIKAFDFVKSARDDYIRTENDYNSWLLNTNDWGIRPSIAFFDGIPYVLTCRDHDKGTKKFIIHPPRQPSHNLASRYYDQLGHCSIRTRTVGQLRHSYFSTGYQMHEQRGTFNGIDTCNLTSYHQFDFRSKLLSDSESRSIVNRPDINGLLNQLVEEKK